MKKLVFVEGVSGVGKSATAAQICRALEKTGHVAKCHLEGDISSPVDLFQTTYLTGAEYDNLILTYPGYADEISKSSIFGRDYTLVRYQCKEGKRFSSELYEYLRDHEFCCNPRNPAPIATFTAVFSDLWRRFADNEHNGYEYVILDGSLLHHQTNDLICNYNASDADILRHLTALLQTVAPLNPIVFYLSSPDVAERLKKARESRGQTAPAKEKIAFWENRKRVDLFALDRLPVESHIIDITNGNWGSAVETMLSHLV